MNIKIKNCIVPTAALMLLTVILLSCSGFDHAFEIQTPPRHEIDPADSQVVADILTLNKSKQDIFKAFEKRNNIGQVTVLRLQGCKTIPSSIGKLTTATEFYLEDTVQSLPKEIGLLTNLEKFTFTINQNGNSNAFPDELGNLAKLTELRLTAIGQVIYPECITRLTKLKNLDLLGTEIESIPNSYSKFKALSSLRIGQCTNKKIPEFVFGLNGINWFSASHDSLGVFPLRLGVVNINNVFLADNNFKEIPDSALKLWPTLEILDLSHNSLQKLPDSIGNYWPKLYELYLNNNDLSTLPASITNIAENSSLFWIFLDSNCLTDIPDSLITWINVHSLNKDWQKTQRKKNNVL